MIMFLVVCPSRLLEEGYLKGAEIEYQGLRGEIMGAKTGVTGGGMMIFLVVYPSRLLEEGDLKGAEIET